MNKSGPLTTGEDAAEFAARVLGCVTLDDIIAELGRRYPAAVILTIRPADPEKPSGAYLFSKRAAGNDWSVRGMLAFAAAKSDAEFCFDMDSCDEAGRR